MIKVIICTVLLKSSLILAQVNRPEFTTNYNIGYEPLVFNDDVRLANRPGVKPVEKPFGAVSQAQSKAETAYEKAYALYLQQQKELSQANRFSNLAQNSNEASSNSQQFSQSALRPNGQAHLSQRQTQESNAFANYEYAQKGPLTSSPANQQKVIQAQNYQQLNLPATSNLPTSTNQYAQTASSPIASQVYGQSPALPNRVNYGSQGQSQKGTQSFGNRQSGLSGPLDTSQYIDNSQYSLIPLTAQGPSSSNLQNYPPPARPASGVSRPLAPKQPEVAPQKPSSQVASFVNPISETITGFGIEVIKKLEDYDDGNKVISPLSISTMLALLQQGSEGVTQKQLMNILRLTPSETQSQFKQMIGHIKKRSSRNILKFANNIFVSKSFAILSQYSNIAKNFFDTELTLAEFLNPVGAANLINDWFAKKTQGAISDIVNPDSVGPGTQLVLANAVYFKGLWNSTFSPDRTVPMPFTLANGARQTAQFMHHNGEFAAGEDQDLGAQYLVMPFEGFEYSLVVVVPSPTMTIKGVLQQLTPVRLATYAQQLPRDVLVSLPKFKIRFDTNLDQVLQSLGLRAIFTANSGLTAIGSSSGQHPKVTDALHTAILSIDEHGGSAVAATAFIANTLSLDGYDQEFRFKADRPFLAVLWDNRLSLPLFIAKIADPSIVN